MLDISLQDHATPPLKRLIDGLHNPLPLYQSAGAHGQECVRDYLIVLAGSRHATAENLGAQPSGHLGKAAEKVALPSALKPIPDGIAVSINHPGMSRAFKDVKIRPGQGKKYLTIPATAEAYNRRAYRFTTLEVLFGRKGPYALGERQKRDKSGQQPACVFYWLVKSVSQPQDRTLLPGDDAILRAAMTGVRDFVDILIAMKAV